MQEYLYAFVHTGAKLEVLQMPSNKNRQAMCGDIDHRGGPPGFSREEDPWEEWGLAGRTSCEASPGNMMRSFSQMHRDKGGCWVVCWNVEINRDVGMWGLPEGIMFLSWYWILSGISQRLRNWMSPLSFMHTCCVSFTQPSSERPWPEATAWCWTSWHPKLQAK